MKSSLKTPVILIALAVTAAFFFGFLPVKTGAQIITGVSINISPQFPKPYETIDVSLDGTSVDLSRASITWFINDRERAKGIGERNIRVKLGGPGSVARIRAEVAAASGARTLANATIRPASVDILWSGHSYVPPFYRGRALPSSNGFVVLHAMPTFIDSGGGVIDPNEIVYTWVHRGVTLGESSGYGKNRIVLEAEPTSFQPMVVSVVAETLNGSISAQDTVRFRVANPFVLFYEKHPLSGIRYNNVLFGTVDLVKEEMTIRGEPYYFALDDIANDLLTYEWRINNEDVSPRGERLNELTIRKTGGTGEARIAIRVRNKNLDKVLQEFVGSFIVRF